MSVEGLYAPPSSSTSDPDDPDALDISVSGDLIQGYTPMHLPSNRCLKCGGSSRTGGKMWDKKLYYVPNWTYLLILLNLVIAAIVQVVIRKRVDITYYVCETCWRQRTKRLWLSGGIFVASAAALVGSAALSSGGLAIFAGIGLLGGLIALGLMTKPPLRAVSHSDGLFSLKGASDEFLTKVRADQPVGGRHYDKW